MSRQLQSALMGIVGMLNSPRYDDLLLREAGAALDRALFPLLVRLDARGPLAVVELADVVGRDHSTVSRQLARLEMLGLVSRGVDGADQRVRRAAITGKGRRLAARLSAARDRLFERLLADWNAEDRAALGRLSERFAESMARLGRPS